MSFMNMSTNLIELTDGALCILGTLEHNSSRALCTPIRTNVDVSPDNASGRAEEVLKVLPSSLVGELTQGNNGLVREVSKLCLQ